jgi:hypothetical protein
MKKRLLQSFTLTAFIVLLVVSGWTVYHHVLGTGVFRPILVCPQRLLKLGEIDGGQPRTCVFTITNKGYRSLIIRDVRTGCAGCVNILDYPKTPIKKNQSATITVDLLTENINGPTRKSFLVKTNDPVTPIYAMVIDAIVKNDAFHANAPKTEK